MEVLFFPLTTPPSLTLADFSIESSLAVQRLHFIYVTSMEKELIKGCSSSLQCMDMGEDMGVPDDFSEQDLTSGMWWRHLVAVCLC